MLASLQFGVKNFSLAEVVLKMDCKIQNACLVDFRLRGKGEISRPQTLLSYY